MPVSRTADYMAPEQALDCHNVDPRADLYSLGCTLYCLLTGRPPFLGKTFFDRLLLHQKSTPTPVENLRRDVPHEMVEIVRRLMAKRPDDRYPTAAEAAADLARWAIPRRA